MAEIELLELAEELCVRTKADELQTRLNRSLLPTNQILREALQHMKAASRQQALTEALGVIGADCGHTDCLPCRNRRYYRSAITALMEGEGKK